MRAAVHDRYGPPEVLRVSEVARPVPGDDEVLVRVQASTVTRGDTELRNLTYPFSRLFTGIRCHDTQSGFRSYPLAAIGALPLQGDRYDLEMEVLFAAARAGIPIREVPIRVTYTPEGGRVTHFRPVRDFVQIGIRVARTLRRLR